jgi:hypothetical protein
MCAASDPKDSGADTELTYIVIGRKGSLRSASLREMLASSSVNVEYVHPVYVDSGDESTLCDQPLARRLFGRELTLGEIGCHEAHRRAYLAAARRGGEWTIIIEDDAVVPANFPAYVSEILRAHAISTPRLVTFCALGTSPGIRRSRRIGGLERVKHAPPYAVCYALNARAVDVACKAPSRAVSTADWPPWTSQVECNVDRQSRVGHPLDGSIIGERQHGRHRWHLLKRIGHLANPWTAASARPYFASLGHYWSWSLGRPTRNAFSRRLRPFGSKASHV